MLTRCGVVLSVSLAAAALGLSAAEGQWRRERAVLETGVPESPTDCGPIRKECNTDVKLGRTHFGAPGRNAGGNVGGGGKAGGGSGGGSGGKGRH